MRLTFTTRQRIYMLRSFVSHHHGTYKHHIQQSDHFWFILKALLLVLVVLSLLVFARAIDGQAGLNWEPVAKTNEQSISLTTNHLPLAIGLYTLTTNESLLISNLVSGGVSCS